MADKARGKKAEGATEAAKPLADMAEAARRNYEHAVRTGQRFQEEAGQWWSKVLGQAGATVEWQKPFTQFTTLATRVMPLAQRRMEDALELMEKNSRTSAELMKKALEAAQTTTVAEAQTKWLEFWSSGMKAMQTNVAAATEFGTKAVDSWLDLVRKNAAMAEPHVGAAA